MTVSQRSTYDTYAFSGPGRHITLAGGSGSQAVGTYQGSDLQCTHDALRPRTSEDYPTRNVGQLRKLGSGTARLIRAEIAILPYDDYISGFGYASWAKETIEIWATRRGTLPSINSCMLASFPHGTHVCDIEVPPGYSDLVVRYTAAPTYFFAGLVIADGTYSRANVHVSLGFEVVA